MCGFAHGDNGFCTAFSIDSKEVAPAKRFSSLAAQAVCLPASFAGQSIQRRELTGIETAPFAGNFFVA